MTNAAKASPRNTKASKASSADQQLSNGMRAPNPLQAYLGGATVRPVEKIVKSGDRLTAFFGKYVRGQTSGAEQGWTGPMIGQWLCSLGYIAIANPKTGTVIEAGTDIAKIPHHDDLYEAGAIMEVVKDLPTRQEFWQMVGSTRKAAK